MWHPCVQPHGSMHVVRLSSVGMGEVLTVSQRCEADNFDSNWVSEKRAFDSHPPACIAESHFAEWSTNCQSFNNHGIDASTGDRLFSKWAFATNYGGIWSPERSRQIALTGRILGPPKTELAAGAVAGIVITILVILTLVGAGVYLFRRRQRAKQQDGEVTPDQFMAVLYDSHGAHSLPRTPGSKSMSDQANVPVSRTLGSPNAPAATAAVAAVDADSIALAILRRVGHEPPGYTPAGSHESVISACPPPSQVSNPFSHDTMSTSDFGSVSTPSVSSADHRREKRQTIPPPPIEKD